MWTYISQVVYVPNMSTYYPGALSIRREYTEAVAKLRLTVYVSDVVHIERQVNRVAL